MASKNRDGMIPHAIYESGIWKGVKYDMPEGYFKLGERILTQFKTNPNFVGQIDSYTGQEDTFKSMGDRSIRCALWLKKQGICRGDNLSVYSKNQLDCCIPLFVSLYLGTIFSPLSRKDLDEELARYCMETRKPKVVFVDEYHAEMIVETAKILGYSIPVVIFGQKTGLLSFTDILKAQTDEEVEKFKCAEINAEDPAIIVNTTGTTSTPKGVVKSYGAVAHMLHLFPNDASPATILAFYGINGIAGIRTIIRGVIFKATMINTHIRSAPEEYFELIEKYKVTQVWMMIYTASKLIKTRGLWKYDLSSVEMVTYGGGIAEEEIVESLQKIFKNAKAYPRFSSTESGDNLTTKLDPAKLTSCGKVMANVEMKIVDPDTNEILGPNEEGELCCRTPKMMTGYLNDPAATAEAIDSEGWYHTGDLGYYDNDGDFFIIERIKEFIRNSCRKTSSSSIADAIKEVPGVAEVVVVPKPDKDYFEVPIAFITIIPGARITEADINRVMVMKFPDFLKLRGIFFLEEMPTSSNGKIDKRKLRTIAKASYEGMMI